MFTATVPLTVTRSRDFTGPYGATKLYLFSEKATYPAGLFRDMPPDGMCGKVYKKPFKRQFPIIKTFPYLCRFRSRFNFFKNSKQLLMMVSSRMKII